MNFVKSGLITSPYLGSFTDNDHFKFTTGSFDELTKYLFGKKQYAHEFCPTCGCGIVATGEYML